MFSIWIRYIHLTSRKRNKYPVPHNSGQVKKADYALKKCLFVDFFPIIEL